MWPLSDVETSLRRGYEIRAIEAKAACLPTDADSFGGIAKAVLAMSNLSDGGHVIVGVDDQEMVAMTPGLTDEQVTAWRRYDKVCDQLARYADPPLAIEVTVHTLSAGIRVAVLDVPGLGGMPHFCAKDQNGQDDGRKVIVRKGALYIRSIHKPETVELKRVAEMNELLNAALSSRLRAFVQTAERAGLRLSVDTIEPGGRVPLRTKLFMRSNGLESGIEWPVPSSTKSAIAATGTYQSILSASQSPCFRLLSSKTSFCGTP